MAKKPSQLTFDGVVLPSNQPQSSLAPPPSHPTRSTRQTRSQSVQSVRHPTPPVDAQDEEQEREEEGEDEQEEQEDEDSEDEDEVVAGLYGLSQKPSASNPAAPTPVADDEDVDQLAEDAEPAPQLDNNPRSSLPPPDVPKRPPTMTYGKRGLGNVDTLEKSGGETEEAEQEASPEVEVDAAPAHSSAEPAKKPPAPHRKPTAFVAALSSSAAALSAKVKKASQSQPAAPVVDDDEADGDFAPEEDDEDEEEAEGDEQEDGEEENAEEEEEEEVTKKTTKTKQRPSSKQASQASKRKAKRKGKRRAVEDDDEGDVLSELDEERPEGGIFLHPNRRKSGWEKDRIWLHSAEWREKHRDYWVSNIEKLGGQVVDDPASADIAVLPDGLHKKAYREAYKLVSDHDAALVLDDWLIACYNSSLKLKVYVRERASGIFAAVPPLKPRPRPRTRTRSTPSPSISPRDTLGSSKKKRRSEATAVEEEREREAGDAERRKKQEAQDKRAAAARVMQQQLAEMRAADGEEEAQRTSQRNRRKGRPSLFTNADFEVPPSPERS